MLPCDLCRRDHGRCDFIACRDNLAEECETLRGERDKACDAGERVLKRLRAAEGQVRTLREALITLRNESFSHDESRLSFVLMDGGADAEAHARCDRIKAAREAARAALAEERAGEGEQG